MDMMIDLVMTIVSYCLLSFLSRLQALFKFSGAAKEIHQAICLLEDNYSSKITCRMGLSAPFVSFDLLLQQAFCNGEINARATMNMVTSIKRSLTFL